MTEDLSGQRLLSIARRILRDSSSKISIQTAAISAIPMLLCFLFGAYKHLPYHCYDSATQQEQNWKSFKYFGISTPCGVEQNEIFAFPPEWEYFLLFGSVVAILTAASSVYFRRSRLAATFEIMIYPFFVLFGLVAFYSSVAKFRAFAYFQDTYSAAVWVLAVVLFFNALAAIHLGSERWRAARLK